MLRRFRVNDVKPRTTPLANHFKLSKEQSPKTAKERDHMALVPYASTVGSLMYVMSALDLIWHMQWELLAGTW